MRVGGIGNDPVIDDSSPSTSRDDDTSSRIRDRISRRRDDDPATSGIGSTTEERKRSSSSSSGSSSTARDRRRIREATTIDRNVGLADSAAAASGSADAYGDFDSPGPDGAGGQGTPTVPSSDSGDAIDRATEMFTTRVAEPFGDLVADASPVTAIEEATTGTDRSRRFMSSAGTGVAQLANIPGYVAGARSGLQAQSETQDAVGFGPFVSTAGVPNPSGRAEQSQRAGGAAAGAAGAAADDPFSAAGLVTGAVAGGLGVAGAASRASRVSTPSGFGSGRSTFDFDDFVGDARAQTGLGRRRRRDGDDDPQSDLNVDMDDLDDLLGDFERAERSRRVQERVRQRSVERGREAGRRQEPERRQGLDEDMRFDPDRSVAEGQQYDPDALSTFERGTFDTSRSGPRSRQQQQMDSFVRSQFSDWYGSGSSSAADSVTDAFTMSTQQQARAQNVPQADLRSVLGQTGTQAGSGPSGMQGAALGTLSGVNDPTGISDTSGLTPGAELAARTAADFGDLDAQGLGALSIVNDPSGLTDTDGPVGVGTGLGYGTGTELGNAGVTDETTDTGLDGLTGMESDTGVGGDTDTTTTAGTQETTAQTFRVGGRTAIGTEAGQATATGQDTVTSRLGTASTFDETFSSGTSGGGGGRTGRPLTPRIPPLDLEGEGSTDAMFEEWSAEDDFVSSGIADADDVGFGIGRSN